MRKRLPSFLYAVVPGLSLTSVLAFAFTGKPALLTTAGDV